MNATSLNLTPRYDLQLPGVIIYYKKMHTQDGVPGLRYFQDKYPPELSDWYPDARIHTIELLGSTQTTVRQKLISSTVQANNISAPTRLAWWKTRIPWLKDANVTSLAIDYSTVTIKDDNDAAVSLATYPYEILDGAVTDWMESEYDVAFKSVTITGKADYTVQASGGITSAKPRQKVMNHRCKVCNFDTAAAEHEFIAVAFNDPGEPFYLGLSQAIYESHQALQYEGSVSLVGDQIPSDLHLGQLLTINTPGGTYPDNLIQRITGELTRGRVTLAIGPPSHLGIADMIELMRVNRYRLVYNLPSNANNPLAAGTNDVTLSKSGAKENSQSGAGTALMISATAPE